MIRHEIDMCHEVHGDGHSIDLPASSRSKRSSVPHTQNIVEIVRVEMVPYVADNPNEDIGLYDVSLQRGGAFLQPPSKYEGGYDTRKGDTEPQ